MSNAAQVTAILASLSQSVAGASPDLGFGYDGERPPEGVHDCYLMGMTVQPGQFTKGDKTKIPSIRFQFEYRLVNDPTRSTPLEWKGESLNIPQGGSAALPAGAKKNDRNATPAQLADGLARFFAEKDEGRLNGIISTILGRPVTNLAQDVAAVQSILNSSTMLGISVKCEYSPDKRSIGPDGKPTKWYFREYAQRLISAPSTGTQATPTTTP